MHMRDWLESCSSIDLAAAFLVLSSGEASQIPTWMRRCRDELYPWVVTVETTYISWLLLYLLLALIDLPIFDVAFWTSRIL